jgi:FemAB-related protein (PEP-CTERM system-associated)
MKVKYLLNSTEVDWDEFVSSHENGTIYHTLAWKNIVEQHFKKKTYYLYVEQDNIIQAILPLVFFKSVLFGQFLISFPYVNYGGLLSLNVDATQLLLAEANGILSSSGSEFIEFRTLQENAFDLPVKTKKVTYYLTLPKNEEALMQQFKAKLRSQIRRPIKEGMTAKIVTEKGLNDFYQLFSIKMRDLGTPVYSLEFFQTILHQLPNNAKIIIVYSKTGMPVAAAFVIYYQGLMEIPWAASLRKYDKLSPNMLLYFEVLKYAMAQKCHTFDFGRCTIGSGTYRFKKQWGGSQKTLYWYYLLAAGQAMPEVNPNNPKYKIAIQLWQNLPLKLTQWIGPLLVKHIP